MLQTCMNTIKDNNAKRIILYFTGTGNCLYVARQLADDDTEVLSIPHNQNT